MLEDIIQEIINEAKEGKITISSSNGNWNFFAKFYVNEYIDDLVPTIAVPNYKRFINEISDYLDSAYDFYYDDKEFYELDDRSYIKKLVFDLLVSVTSFDCNDIYNYINRKKNMIDDKTIKASKFNFGKYLELDTMINIRKNKSNLEAPYQFIITFKDNEGNSFELPQITFGVVNSEVYLVCVQNKNKNENKLTKKMDRFFRKVNKNIDSDDDIAKVSPNALVSLTIFNAYLKTIGIDRIVTPSYMPIRYNSKVIKNINKGYVKEELEKENEIIDRDQFNITNKMMYLLNRYVYHFSDCLSEYDDIKDEMHLKLNDTMVNDDNIILGIDNIFTRNNKKR